METEAPPSPLPPGSFIGHESFRNHLRTGLLAAAQQGWRELLLSDADFRHWPLGEREVVEALTAWVRGARRFTMLAKSYDEVPRLHARFVEWRRLWSHRIDCRVCREADATELPSALWTPGWTVQRLDLLHSSGLCGDDPARRLLLREQIDGWLVRSTPGFPAYTLGL